MVSEPVSLFGFHILLEQSISMMVPVGTYLFLMTSKNPSKHPPATTPSRLLILPHSSSSSFRKSISSKMDYLYEISYLDKSNKITPTSLPLVNLCLAYSKPWQSFSMSSPKNPSKRILYRLQSSINTSFLPKNKSNFSFWKSHPVFQTSNWQKDIHTFILEL